MISMESSCRSKIQEIVVPVMDAISMNPNAHATE